MIFDNKHAIICLFCPPHVFIFLMTLSEYTPRDNKLQYHVIEGIRFYNNFIRLFLCLWEMLQFFIL